MDKLLSVDLAYRVLVLDLFAIGWFQKISIPIPRAASRNSEGEGGLCRLEFRGHGGFIGLEFQRHGGFSGQ